MSRKELKRKRVLDLVLGGGFSCLKGIFKVNRVKRFKPAAKIALTIAKMLGLSSTKLTALRLINI